MARSVIKKDILLVSFDYGTVTINGNSSALINIPKSNIPPTTYNGKSLVSMFVNVDKDYIIYSISFYNRNITAFNHYSNSQDVKFDVIAVYE